jgi:TATA-binding protein-associated factor
MYLYITFCFSRLKDSDDDVRAVAASILIPIADSFVSYSSNKIPEIVSVLWDCLKDLKDDLTASTASVMDFLGMYRMFKRKYLYYLYMVDFTNFFTAKLFSFPSVLEYMRIAAASDPRYSAV